MNEERTKLIKDAIKRIKYSGNCGVECFMRKIDMKVISDKMCPKCGTTTSVFLDPREYDKCDIRDIMEKKGWCFGCAFWENLYRKNKDNPNWVIIKGDSWILTPRKEGDKSRIWGLGGTRMVAKKKDGTIIDGNNWWYQGKIPPEFRDLMPDNAEWVEDED